MRADARESASEFDVLARAVEATTGLQLGPEARDRFTRYLDLLLAWNRVQRLTGLRSRSDIVSRLFADSMLFLPLLPLRRPLRIVDIGAGAGIPGYPIAIIDRGVTVTMIESRRKRVSFLKTVARELALERDVTIVEGRAEQVRETVRSTIGAFDVAVARAVESPEALADVALGYLNPGGKFIASGPPDRSAETETERPEHTVRRLSRHVVKYPALGLRRVFLVALDEG